MSQPSSPRKSSSQFCKPKTNLYQFMKTVPYIKYEPETAELIPLPLRTKHALLLTFRGRFNLDSDTFPCICKTVISCDSGASVQEVVEDHAISFSNQRAHMPDLNRYGFLFNWKRECYVIDLLSNTETLISMLPSGKMYGNPEACSDLWNHDFHVNLIMLLLLTSSAYSKYAWSNDYISIRALDDVSEIFKLAGEFDFPYFEMVDMSFELIKKELESDANRQLTNMARSGWKIVDVTPSMVAWEDFSMNVAEYSTNFELRFSYTPDDCKKGMEEADNQDRIFRLVSKAELHQKRLELAEKIMKENQISGEELLKIGQAVSSQNKE